MTKEERELRREQREHMKRMEAAAKEAGRGPIDVPFLLLVLLLTGVGLIMLLSASFPSAYYESGDPLYYFKRQAAFATLGLAAMVVIGRINYARFRGVAKIALGVSIALLVAVIIPGVGITSHGATRWLGIPGTTMRFQPSEIAKLGVILYFADSISKKKDKMRTLRYGILPYGFILVLIALLSCISVSSFFGFAGTAFFAAFGSCFGTGAAAFAAFAGAVSACFFGASAKFSASGRGFLPRTGGSGRTGAGTPSHGWPLTTGILRRFSFSMPARYSCSSGAQKLTAVPSAPARAVRPMRCT